jgi:manganese/iron transport system substrate-binding protein
MFVKASLQGRGLSRLVFTLLAVAATASLSACGPGLSPQRTHRERPSVLVTDTVLCDLVRQVAAETVDRVCLIAPGADPHIYEPTPGDRQKIEQADLILYGGYSFEPNLIKLIRATRNPVPKIAVDEVAVPIPQTFREAGAVEPDPHVWNSAKNGQQMVETVQRSLTQLEPSHKALYLQNAQRLNATLSKIDDWIRSQIATIPPQSRKLVTTHDALGYYATAYGIPVEGALLGISTEARPSAARVKALVDSIKAAQVPTIFVELSASPKLIEAIAKESHVKVSPDSLYADGLGALGSSGDTYPKMLIANTEAIVKGLGGKPMPFNDR